MNTEQKVNILLVDDRPENLLALEATLGGLGLNLVRAKSGQEALECVLREDFAAILLDVQMPDLNGFEAATRIRGRERSGHTPIIFVTAVGIEEELVARGYEAGAVDYLIKPFPPDALRAKVLAMAAQFRERMALEERLPAALREQRVDILLVDDRPENLLAMEEALRDLGENLVTAGSGREALRLLLRGEFALALLDVRMPDLDGFELAGMIRGNRRARDTQIIFTTAAHRAAEDVSRGYALGAVDYLFTPFAPDILRSKVRALVDLVKRKKVLERQVLEIERLNGELRRLNETLERRVAERTEALRKAEEQHVRLGMAVEQAAESIIITDADGTIVYVNPAFEKVSGYNREEAVGQNPRILKSGRHDAEFYRGMWSTLVRGEAWSGRFTNKRKDGGLYEDDAIISPVRDQAGEVINYVAVQRDVTQEAALEQQLFQAQKMEAIGTLAGGIAHDFNNLLTGIIGYAQLTLLDESLNPQVREGVARIPELGKQAAQLISQLLTFSRRSAVERRPMSLLSLVKETVKVLQRTTLENIAVRLNAPREVATINADPTQMQQVLMNLCVNASQAMPDGGELTIGLENVALDEDYCRQYSYARPGDYVCLSVRDTGVGMTPEVQEHIFEPFFTTKGVGEGTGLGLASAYGIVKTHEGHVNVSSEVGRGSEFKVYIPAIRGKTTWQAVSSEERPAGGTETLLLVEDQDMVLTAGQNMLERLGYTVLTARNGEEAMEVYRARRNEIALVLTDKVMPKMGGDALYEALKQIDPAVKVLLMSGYGMREEVDGLRSRGLKGFVQKPLEINELGRAVRRALDE